MPTSTKAAVKAITAAKVKAAVGTVVSFGVETPGGRKPTFNAPDQQVPIYCENTGGDTFVASWVPTTEGVHEITASLDDADSATFTVTATINEEG